MGDREILLEDKAVCDLCGNIGAYDFMGDYYCPDCMLKYVPIDEESEEIDMACVCEHCHFIMDCGKDEECPNCGFPPEGEADAKQEVSDRRTIREP